MVSVFGSNLSYQSDVEVSQATISGNRLPTQLGGVSVLVDNRPAALLFVGKGQINFLVPSDEITGDVKIQVVRQGVAGPAITLALEEAAPALFLLDGYAIAQDYNNKYAVVTPDVPAHAGDTIVLYATGLGHTQPNPNPGEIPPTAAYVDNAANLKVLLNGSAIDPALIKYAGLTPGSAGLYQINFILPGGLSDDVEIRVSLDGQTSAAGVKLAVR